MLTAATSWTSARAITTSNGGKVDGVAGSWRVKQLLKQPRLNEGSETNSSVKWRRVAGNAFLCLTKREAFTRIPDAVEFFTTHIGLDSQPGKFFGFQLRNDAKLPARQGMLDLLRDAFERNLIVNIDFFQKPGKNNNILFRVWLTR